MSWPFQGIQQTPCPMACVFLLIERKQRKTIASFKSFLCYLVPTSPFLRFMLPASPQPPHPRLFQTSLMTELDAHHELVGLSVAIPWRKITTRLETFYPHDGRPSCWIRLMASCWILKTLYNLSHQAWLQP